MQSMAVLKQASVLMSEDQLKTAVAHAKARGEKIVMTKWLF